MNDTEVASAPYEPPLLGDAVAVVSATLFSGAVDPDAGVIDFGGG